MPVIDLRNPFGVPEQAPSQPVFQRTRQLLPAQMPTSRYESALAFERAAPLIQANQGLAYLGEVQNHQAEIAQQAQNLRIQQEAQLAAQQATQGLASAMPNDPRYLQQRQQVLQQNPNALMDPQFRNALQVYDQGYSQFDRQRQLQANQQAAAQKQAHSLGLRAIEYGAPADVVAEHVATGNMGALAQLAGEARRSSLAKPKGAESTDYRTKAAYGKYLDAIADGEVEAATAIEDLAKRGGFHWETPMAPVVESAAPIAAASAVAPPAPATTQPDAIQNVDLSKIPYAKREKYVADLEKAEAESQDINKVWNDAQLGIQSKLEKELAGNIGRTNYSKLRSFAEAVVNGDVVPSGELGAGGEYELDVPVEWPIFKKLGIHPDSVAFEEPGNRRTGTQKVTYGDVLKTWAKNYLNTAPTTVVPQVPALAPKKAEALESVFDSLVKPSKS